jgi:putative transposase
MFVVMPNHLHGLIAIDRNADECATHESTHHQKSLGSLVGAFKTVATRRINSSLRTPCEPVWQRSFYEHVVRGPDSIAGIQEYIESNPARWMLDEENPDHRK